MRLVSIILSFVLSLLLALVATQPARATVNVHIDLTTQSMSVRSSSGEAYNWRVSTARRGYVTPRGVYRAQRLARMHYSRKYDNAPMPHSIFFRGGYAIHGTNAVGALGRPASHGCVRLAPAAAARLFAMVQKEGARISIGGASPASQMIAKSSKTRLAKAHKAKSRYAQAKSRYAKAQTRHHRYAATHRAPTPRIYGGVELRGGYDPALGYAAPQRQPSMRQWLRAPSW